MTGLNAVFVYVTELTTLSLNTKKNIMNAKFTHVMNDDCTHTTFIYFDHGFVQHIEGSHDYNYMSQFCIHVDSKDIDKLISALKNEPNENTVFTPNEMKLIRNLVNNCFPDTPIDNMTQKELEQFIEKVS